MSICPPKPTRATGGRRGDADGGEGRGEGRGVTRLRAGAMDEERAHGGSGGPALGWPRSGSWSSSTIARQPSSPAWHRRFILTLRVEHTDHVALVAAAARASRRSSRGSRGCCQWRRAP